MNTNNPELEILAFADDYELVEYQDASAYLIVNKNQDEYQCMFGFITFPNDLEVASKLFEGLENAARKRGFKHLVGPINYCTWLSYRWTISNFDFKLYPDCTNPEYYPQIVEKLGYKQLYTYRSVVIDIDNPVMKMGELVLKQKMKEGYEFKFYDKETAPALVKDFYDISADAFVGSKLYAPLPFEAFEKIYLTWVRNLDMAVGMAYYQGEAIGYVFGYQNPYDPTMNISKTTAVKKAYQKNKVYAALVYMGCKYILEQGAHETVYHFQCEQRDTFKRFDPRIESNEKRYAVYIKEL